MPDDHPLDRILDDAMAQHEAGHFDLAAASCRTVLQHDPDEPDALNLLAVILQDRGNVEESIALLTHALDILPDFPEALANLARAQCAAGMPAAAAAAARRAIALEPGMLEPALQLGRALSDLGDHAGAVEALRNAAALASQSAAALHQIGIALLRLHDPQIAADCLSAALELDPQHAGIKASLIVALVDAARVHLAAGRTAAAAAAARRAVEFDPGQGDAQTLLELAQLGAAGSAEAIVALRHATATNPRSLATWAALATALARRNDHRSAAEAWRAALTLQPDDPEVLFKYASALADSEQYDAAIIAFRRADALAPGEPRVAYCIALCLVRTGNEAAAAELCRRTIDLAPDWPELWMLMANAEARLGNFAAAARGFRRTLELAPGSPEALHDLMSVGERLDDEAAREALREALHDTARPVDDRIAAGFALGQAGDRDGLYDEAFTAYAVANRLLREQRASRGTPFNRLGIHGMVNRLIATIGPHSFTDTVGWGDPSQLPVFVVGMPRSGTSLVEQIAASHPAIHGAGELKDIPRIVRSLAGEGIVTPPSGWDRTAVRSEAATYAAYLRGLAPGAARVIDKQPNNLIYLGQIAVLFPRARIVVCRRDLRDTCLSCFFQFFRDENVSWADDLADCAFRAREMDRLMQLWRQVLPMPMLEVQYENLVANPEAESRRLIDFLGLPWDPACLTFHQTERTVQTASQWQVRQPMYASSVGRWRHYQRHLGPLLEALEGLVPADGAGFAPAAGTPT